MAKGPQRIGILHLSDVQFGPNHRFTQGADSLAARLIPTLRELPEGARPIDLVVFSGDAAEHGLPDQLADAARFLAEVLDALGLDAERLVVVPGNHDISRDAVKAQVHAALSQGKEAQPPFEQKWDNYRAFLRALGGNGGSDDVDKVQRFADLGLTVSALNSTVAETADEHYGFCGEEQLEAHARALAEHPGDIRMAVVHHNVRQAAPDDAENLRDEQDLVRILGAHVDLVLHGHRHAAGRDYLSNGRLILSAGSAALKREQRPDETPNQFQVLSVSGAQVERWGFSFDPKDKRWVVDATLAQDGVVGYESIALAAPGAAPAASSRTSAVAAPPHPTAVEDPLAAPAAEAQLDDDAVARFRNDLRDDADGLRDGVLTPMELLGRMDLLRGGAVTVGAALLFGRRPQHELPAAFVQCVRYLGEDVAAERESLRVEGTARTQIDEALRFLRERIPRRERPGTETARAELVYSYPMTCLREVVVNAIVHRDYTDTQRNVHVRLFSDRIEVASPGAWCTERSIDGGKPLEAVASQSVKRNPRVAHAMSLIRYFEGEGSGIPTAIRDAAAIHARRPTVRVEDGFVVVTVFPAQMDADAIDLVRARAQERARTEPLLPDRMRGTADATYVSPQIASSDGRVIRGTGRLVRGPDRQVLLLGAPGGGKSTLLAELARRLARGKTVIPFMIDARDVAAATHGDVAQIVHELWQSQAREAPPVDSLRRIFEQSASVLLVDGLDEVGDLSHRSRVIDIVAATVARYPRLRAVVAARPAGLPVAARSWRTFRLLPWSQAQIVKYLIVMGRAAGLDSDARERLVRLTSGDARLLALAETPLLGAAIVSVYGALGEVPTSRFELLRAAADLLIEDWDTRRGLVSRAGTRTQRDVLRLLALCAFEQGMGLGALPLDWCCSQVRPIASYAGLRPEDLLGAVLERGSLLVEAQPGVLAFRVLALAELLAAEELEGGRMRDSDDLFEAAIALAADSHTRMVAELALLSRQSSLHSLTLVPDLLAHASRREAHAQRVALDLAASLIADGNDDPRATAAFLRAWERQSRDGNPLAHSTLVERVHAELSQASAS